ncbi:ankyrin repeat domain-containing protein [Alkalilimnicola ehrlichii]|uniref:ankyrin repeat domain-containing protein n=1 Tax=Alkalilimnicola ehrlichii TaxID=351052 RepID=UPI0015F29424|nr:ankyrin repeat domain-containing protein [Alkalilimnicola ehrlichii]
MAHGAEVEFDQTEALSRYCSALRRDRVGAWRLLQDLVDSTPTCNHLDPLSYAITQYSPNSVRALLNDGADTEQRANDWNGFQSGWTPLMHAVANIQPYFVELLIEHGADPNGPSLEQPQMGRYDQGDTPLHVAIQENWLEVVDYLLEAGAYPDRTDRSGTTPLMLAARVGNEDAIVQLLLGGASICSRDNQGQAALDIARNTSVKALLIAGGAERCE